MAKRPIIFISHISEESGIARSLQELLEMLYGGMVEVFASSQEQSLTLGSEWFLAIKESLVKANVIIVLCSPVSVTRPWIPFEAGAGWGLKKKVIPLCHSGIGLSELPSPLNMLQGGMLNSPVFIQKTINVISKEIGSLRENTLPDTNLFNVVETFEKEIRESSYIRDTRFVFDLTYQSIIEIELAILHSYGHRPDTIAIDKDRPSLNSYKYDELDLFNLYNISFHRGLRRPYFEIFHSRAVELIENAKFILLYASLNVEPALMDIFRTIASEKATIVEWYDPIFVISTNRPDSVITKRVLQNLKRIKVVPSWMHRLSSI